MHTNITFLLDLQAWWVEMDIDGDNRLSPNEFDNTL
jgi:hypothetical protein